MYKSSFRIYSLMRVETHPNGGASVVYLYQQDVDMLSSTQQAELAKEFLKVSFFFCFTYIS